MTASRPAQRRPMLAFERARAKSGIRTRTDALDAVRAGSVENLISNTNARLRRVVLPHCGSEARGRSGIPTQLSCVETGKG